MDITAKYEITRPDMLRATKFYYDHTGRLWRMSAAVLFTLVGVLALFVPDSRWLGPPLLLCAAMQIATPRANAFMTARRYFSNPNMGRSSEMHMTETGLDAKSEAGTSSINWDIFKSWMESPEAFLLIIYKGYYLVLPKRGFEREEDTAVLRDFLRQRISQAPA